MKEIINAKEYEWWEPPLSKTGKANRRFSTMIFEKKTTPTINMSAGLLILPPGQEQHTKGENAHKDLEEIVYVVRGKGQCVLGGRVVEIEKGTTVYVAPMVDHNFRNTGDEEMEVFWVRCPGGFPLDGTWVDHMTGWNWRRVRR